MRLLIIEDNPMLGKRIAGLFVRDQTTVAATGRDGLDVVGDGYDAVTLDLGLPDMSGIDVCRKIRAGGHTMPVLILTAEDDRPLRDAAEQAGADAYMLKPFKADEVRDAVYALAGV